MTFKVEKYALYFAHLVAWTAMLGSLYFSEVRHFIPCEWCWRQRILMYPLVLITAVGLWRRDELLPYYTLVFSSLGMSASTYHYLLQKTTWFSSTGSCQAGVACSTAYINWLGFITIPFLALIAFMLIFFCSMIALSSRDFIWEDEEDEEDASFSLVPVLSIIAVALLPFAFSFLPQSVQDEHASHQAGAEQITPISDGATLYRETCASCHGPEGEGVANLGSALVGSEFTLNTPDEEWINFVREGRPADHPDNKSGIAMPPSGGRSDLSDDDLQAILSHLRLNSQ